MRPAPRSASRSPPANLPPDLATLLVRVQQDLFDVGADLCTPVVENPEYPPLRVEQAYIDRLEAECDRFSEGLPTLRSFVLAGGTVGAAYLHVARTAVRRAERDAWRAIGEHGDTMNVRRRDLPQSALGLALHPGAGRPGRTCPGTGGPGATCSLWVAG